MGWRKTIFTLGISIDGLRMCFFGEFEKMKLVTVGIYILKYEGVLLPFQPGGAPVELWILAGHWILLKNTTKFEKLKFYLIVSSDFKQKQTKF